MMSPEHAAGQSDAMTVLSQIGIAELLEQEERPTLIVDLENLANPSPGPLQVVFANTSLRAAPGLLELVTGKDHPAPSSQTSSAESSWTQFKAWMISAQKGGESLPVCLAPITYAGIVWTCSTLRRRLRIISGSRSTPGTGSSTPARGRREKAASVTSLSLPEAQALPSLSTAETLNTEPGDYFGQAAAPIPIDTSPALHEAVDVAPSIEVAPAPPAPVGIANIGNEKNKSDSDISDTLDSNVSIINECVLRAATAGHVDQFHSTEHNLSGFFDWTRLPDSADLPPHVQFARSVDWASTSLGPMETWSADLRQMSNLIMASPHPAAMYWGDDLIALYNEAYVLLAGQKHPKLMGQPYREAWAEIWDEVKDVFDVARTTGEATMKVRRAGMPHLNMVH
jgi:hypothetical protein